MFRWYFMVVLLVSSVVQAQSAEQELTDILNTMTSLRANFSQKLLDHNEKVLQESNGVMTILKPGRFKWEIIHPEEIIIIVDQHKILNYDKVLEQVTIQNYNNNSSGLPISDLLSGKQNISKNFIVNPSNKCVGANKCFLLEPKDEQAEFSSAILGFSNNKLVFFQLWDNLGQNSVFNFSNIKFNSLIKDHEFKFKIPPNVDIIKSE